MYLSNKISYGTWSVVSNVRGTITAKADLSFGAIIAVQYINNFGGVHRAMQKVQMVLSN